MLGLDHITVAALSLEEGLAYAEDALGIRMPAGGKHPLMGTHNHLLRLGDHLFLEVIAPDPRAGTVTRPRWFGLDDPAVRADLAGSPRLSTWVVRTPDIRAALARVDGSAGPAITVTRGDLTWLISVPEDGSMPFGGAFPTLIQWPEGPHPASGMADQGCRLRRFTVEHPQGDVIAHGLAPHVADPRVVIRTGPAIRLVAEIDTPDGLRRLGGAGRHGRGPC